MSGLLLASTGGSARVIDGIDRLQRYGQGPPPALHGSRGVGELSINMGQDAGACIAGPGWTSPPESSTWVPITTNSVTATRRHNASRR